MGPAADTVVVPEAAARRRLSPNIGRSNNNHTHAINRLDTVEVLLSPFLQELLCVEVDQL